MAYTITVADVEISDKNEKSGLYQFVITFTDGLKCRVLYNNHSGWKLSGTSRLLNKPCNICRKDYYCKCMDVYSGEIDQQIHERTKSIAGIQ